MDLLRHDNWATQFEVNGIIASKPPLYNWLAAGLSEMLRSTDPWVMKFPSLAAAGFLLWLLYRLTTIFFDQRAAFFGCAALIASHHFSKLMWFARTDMLMTASVYLAIYVLVAVENRWWKSPLLGLIMGASVLIKGPVGPCLFGVFALLWAVRQRMRPSLATLKTVLPGLFLFLVIVITWLTLVLRVPDFYEYVLHNELARRLPGATYKAKPFYYYISHLFTRVAPWSAVAVVGAYFAYRKGKDWQRIRFIVAWAFAFFIFFSAIPSKRHDLLLPVYPVVFMLAGFMLDRMVTPNLTKEARWFATACGILLAAAAGYVVISAGVSTAGAIALAAVLGGTITVVATRRHHPAVLQALAVALVFGNGVYYHWANVGPRVDYGKFARFIREVQTTVGSDHVLVYHAHPLVSYELGLHQEFPDPRDLLDHRPQWLIAPDPEVPIIKSWTLWNLQPITSFDFHGKREIDATLYRVTPPQGALAAREHAALTN